MLILCCWLPFLVTTTTTKQKMLEKTKDDLELETLLKGQSADLFQQFDKNFKTQTDTLSVIVQAKTHSDFNHMDSNKVFWNAAGFINISSFDLKVIVKEMTFATDEWTKRYFARQTCHLIYELTNDLFEILGKDFKEQIEMLTNNENLKTSLVDIRAKLNQFKSANFDTLKEVRNVSSAHRDKDFITQLRSIESINWADTISIATKFDNIMNDLGGVIQKVIDRSSSELDRRL